MRYVLKKVLCFLLCLGIGIAGKTDKIVIAASADIEFFTEDAAIEAEREFTLILEISSDMTIGDFEGYFTYDAELVEYLYGPACITGGDGYLKISDINASASFGLRSYAMTFTAKKHGICQFKMSGIPVVYAYDSGNSMSVATEPYQLTINASSDASNNAEIVALKVSPGTLKPEFSPEITEYEVDLEPLTERLIVSAVAADVRALVSISGNESLSFGENDVNVTVTAEDGTVRVYHILAKRAKEGEAPAPTNPPEGEKSEPSPTPEIKAFYLTPDKQMLCGNYCYQLAQDITGLTIPQGYEADYLLVDGESIPAYMTSRQSEYCLLALVNEAGETGLYRFDRREYTLQRYEPEIVKVADTSGLSQKLNELLERTRDYEQRKNKMSILCGLLSVGIVVLLLLCVKLGLRRRADEDER
jgi:hypothetical protein